MHTDLPLIVSAHDAGKRIDALLRKIMPTVPLSVIYRHLRTKKIRINDARARIGQRVAVGDRIAIPASVTEHDPVRIADDIRCHLAGGASARAARAPRADSADATRANPAPADPAPRADSAPRTDPAPANDATSSALAPALPTASAKGATQPTFDPHYGAILYEDTDIIVLNKRPGAPLFGRRSCQSAIRHYAARTLDMRAQQQGWGLTFQPAALHRLDRNTSGALAFSASTEGARRFHALQTANRLHKQYFALLHGHLAHPCVWRDRLIRDDRRRLTIRCPANQPGADAETRVTPLIYGDAITVALCSIRRAFTHQIRAQASIHRHPLLGDRKYRGYGADYLLHCHTLHIPRLSATPLVAPLFPSHIALLRRHFTTRQLNDMWRQVAMLISAE